MNNCMVRVVFLVSILCFFAGCAGLPHTAPLPQGFALRKITGADQGGPFSLQKGDGILAFSDGSLKAVDLKSGKTARLADEVPTVLAVAPDQQRIAAAFPDKEKGMVRLYAPAGQVLAEASIDGKVTGMVWRGNDELVIAALGIKRYTFGAYLTSMIYRWDGRKAPVASVVNDTTVRPYIAKMPEEQILNSFSVALSPYGDEVAITKLKDPPNFTPFLLLFTHHLGTGGEREIGETAMGSGGPVYAPDGERVLIGQTGAATRWIPTGAGKESDAYPFPGHTIALSPSSAYALVDGHLYLKEKEIATFPPGSAGVFSGDGSALVVAYRNALYLLSGINDPAPPALPKDGRILELRRLHSKGLITLEELEKAKGKK